MGVPGLISLMTRDVPDGCKNVSIKRICEDYQRNNSGKKPTIVFDGNALIYNSNCRNNVYGEREFESFNVMNNFLRDFSSFAEIVVFQEGPMVNDKQNFYLTKKDDRYKTSTNTFDQITRGRSVREVKLRELKSRSSKVAIKKHAKIITAFTKDCDTEIVKFIKENPKTIGVVSDDSDFLIFEGNFKFFSLKDLHIGGRRRNDLFETIEFNRAALRTFLELDNRQLVILSTLCGNEVMNSGRKVFKPIKKIAEEVKRDFTSEKNLNEVVEDLSVKLPNFDRETIKKSLDFYDTNYKTVRFDDPVLKYCDKKHFQMAFTIYNRHPVRANFKIYDLRLIDFQKMADEILKIKKKLAGIIFANNKPDDFALQIYLKLDHETKHDLHKFDAIYPENIGIPEFHEILNREEFPQHDEIRFNLLKWMIGVTERSTDAIDSLPTKNFVEILALTHMVKTGILTIKEADIFMISLNRMNMNQENRTRIDLRSFPDKLIPKAFGLVFVFKEMVTTIGEVLETLGLLHLSNTFFFDGVLFHIVYREYENSDVNLQDMGGLIRHRLYSQ